MAYSNNRITIEGVKVPSEYISKGSFTIVERKRVVEIWTDANMIEHEVTVDQPKAEIQFSFIEHDSSNHERFASFLRKKDNVSITYFSDITNTTRTARFRLEPVQFYHRSSYGMKLQYDVTPVHFIEN